VGNPQVREFMDELARKVLPVTPPIDVEGIMRS
jgi:hypothetical protein